MIPPSDRDSIHIPSNNEGLSSESLDEDSIYEPPMDVIEGSVEIRGITNTNGRGDANRRGWDDIELRPARDIESQTRFDNDDTLGSVNNAIVDTEANVEPTFNNQVLTQGLPEVEAYLVDDGDGEVYDATPLEPTLPWWKQRRTKILLGVVIVLVGALTVALGVSLSNNPEPVLTFVTPTPTISIATSLSIAPSTSPSSALKHS